MQLKEHMASPLIVLLSRAVARYRFGSHINTMITSADAEMMRDALEVSGSSRSARMAMELATVLIASAKSNAPIPKVAHLSNLDRRLQIL